MLYPGRSVPPLRLELFPASTSPSGLPRLRIKPEQLEHQPYLSPAPTTTSPSIQPPTTRLHEIITRIGEICLSPELAHIMLFPAEALAFSVPTQDHTPTAPLPDAYHALCHDPTSVLYAMTDIPSAHLRLDQSAQFLKHFQEACLPAPKIIKYRQPLHLCAWKIESPSRILVYTGRHPSDHEAITASLRQESPVPFLPHTLSKVLLDERSKRPTPSSIHLLNNDQEFAPSSIRASLLHYAQTSLTSHRERFTLLQQKQEHRPRSKQPPSTFIVQDHTLEEAAAIFIEPCTKNHSEIGINQSPPWDKDHVDNRCEINQSLYPPSRTSPNTRHFFCHHILPVHSKTISRIL